MEKITQDDGTIVLQKKPGSDAVLSDTDSLELLDAELRQICGSWIPHSFSFCVLRPAFMDREHHNLIAIRHGDRHEAVAKLISALKTRREEIDNLLGQLHDLHPSPASDDQDEMLDTIGMGVQFLTYAEITETGCEDRWFYELCDKAALYMAALYMESLGCPITMDEVHDIADHYFGSWVEPAEDVVEQFADEVAAMGVKQLFEQTYGTL